MTVAASDAAAAATAEAGDDYVELLQEDEDDDDDVGELPQQPPPMTAGRGERVAAVGGERRVDERGGAADAVQEDGVREDGGEPRDDNDILKENFLFKGLDGDQMTTLLDAMFMANFEAGKAIIEQGDDNFYVVFEGECEVFVSKGSDEDGARLRQGRLVRRARADVQRAARRRARRPTACSSLSPHHVQVHPDGHDDERNLYDSFLKNVPILATLTEYERSTISDALTSHLRRRRDDHLAGQAGDAFYIVEEGAVVCTATPPGAGRRRR